MRRFRFHLGTLLILILVLGVGFAALRESNETWGGSIFSITLGALLISILLAINSTESRRAFWIGFALFGWVYLGLSSVPSIESRMMTTKLLAFLDSKVPGRLIHHVTFQYSATNSVVPINQVHNVAFTPDTNQLGLLDAATGRLLGGWSGTTENFIRIGHSLFALLAAWLGGQLSRRLNRSVRSPAPTSAIQA